MKLVRVMSDEFLNTLDASANLYKKYQMAIHGDTPDQCDRKSFINFLVRSPLQVHFVSNLFVFMNKKIISRIFSCIRMNRNTLLCRVLLRKCYFVLYESAESLNCIVSLN